MSQTENTRDFLVTIAHATRSPMIWSCWVPDVALKAKCVDYQGMSKAKSICLSLYPKCLLQNLLILTAACRIFTWLGWVCQVSPPAGMEVHAHCAEWATVSGTSPLRPIQGFKHTVYGWKAEILNRKHFLLAADNMAQCKGFTHWGCDPTEVKLWQEPLWNGTYGMKLKSAQPGL